MRSGDIWSRENPQIGVQYYTGQVFDMQAITAKAHDVGAICGLDLAHAVGNVILSLVFKSFGQLCEGFDYPKISILRKNKDSPKKNCGEPKCQF